MAALITRCPACATMFKVVPDQLRVSEGWVRCGHCGEVFDARAHMQDAAAVAQAQSAAAPPVSAPAPLADESREEPAHAAPSETPVEPGSELPSESGAPSSWLGAVPPSELDPDELAAEAQTLVEHPLDAPFALRREDLSRPGELTPSRRFAEEEDSELEDEAPPAEEPTFVRQARRQARWRHPVTRIVLSLVVLALAALLLAQVAVQERNRLAAQHPELRPLLATLCAQLGCRIAPPRQIDAIAIDSSSFNKLRPDAYRLQVTLKNQSRIEVAMPALELTLTDGDEQPVVRRVLMPGELAPARPVIPAASDWSGAAAIAITDNSLAGRVAGYRLLAFYP